MYVCMYVCVYIYINIYIYNSYFIEQLPTTPSENNRGIVLYFELPAP